METYFINNVTGLFFCEEIKCFGERKIIPFWHAIFLHTCIIIVVHCC